MRCQPRTARAGYTLVELLLVVALMGLAAALVVPSMDSADALRVQAGVRSIVADITFAQSDALAYQEGRAIVFDPENNSYTVCEVNGVTVDPATDAIWINGYPNNRYEVQFGDRRYADAVIESVDFDGNTTLVIDALGGPVMSPGSDEPGNGGSIIVVGSQSRFSIDVAPFTGRVTVERIEDADADETEPETEPDPG